MVEEDSMEELMEQINWKSLNIPRMVPFEDSLVNTHTPHEYLWAEFIEVFVVTKAEKV